jgi:carbamoyl-phosphate synthase large subunit
VHSGDSACSLPPHTLPRAVQDEIVRQTEALARALNVVGLMNVQFAVKQTETGEDEIYLIEVNPRASRTVPFVAKATDSAIASIAARLMAGEKLSAFPVAEPHAPVDDDTPIVPGDPMSLASFRTPWFSVKEAVLPFNRFPGVDTLLGPEMRSTGEVMGWDRTFPRAFLKAQLGAGTILPDAGCVFISIRDADKTAQLVETARMLTDLGLTLLATRGTADFLSEHGIASDVVNKAYEGGRTIVDIIKDGGVQLVLNTTEGAQAVEDSRSMRAVTLADRIPYFTTLAASHAAALAMRAAREGELGVRSLQA